jgi:hypothetical protein
MPELIQPFNSKPWSNDEVNLRVNMIRDLLKRLEQTDDMTRNNLERELATWRELLQRRNTGV